MKVNNMYQWAVKLFPINRSLTGPGNIKTLNFFKKIIPFLKIKNIKSNTKIYDWKIPEEWSIDDAYIEDLKGNKIIDFKKNNLHVVGYSKAVNKVVSRTELFKHLHFLPNQKNSIPYVTSYYKKYWGFCLSYNQKKLLKDKHYKVYIKSNHKNGNLSYGEIIHKGKSKKEILISTNICHPSLANNELSGPIVTTALAEWIVSKKRYYAYRIIYVPETIGALAYLKVNKKKLKNIYFGLNIVCVGDSKKFSFLSSKFENSDVDKVCRFVLKYNKIKYKEFSYLNRGSDERQYSSQAFNIPVASIMRSKYGEYKQYHTSEDNLDFISSKGLEGSLNIYKEVIKLIEINKKYKAVITHGEPFLTKYELYPSLSLKIKERKIRIILNILAYADGTMDLLDLSEKIAVNPYEVDKLINILLNKKLLIDIDNE